MQLPYCFLEDAQYAQAASTARPMTAAPSVLLRHLLAASRRIDALRGGQLYERRTETLHLPGLVYRDGIDYQWWELGVEVAHLVSVTADDTALDLNDVQQRHRQLGIAASLNVPVVVTADWGPGRRGTAITGQALAATATSITSPDPAPSWWQPGGVFLVGSELIVIASAVTDGYALLRPEPVEHTADDDWTPIASPEHLQEACIGMARRLAWQAANPSKSPEWMALEEGYRSLIVDEGGRG